MATAVLSVGIVGLSGACSSDDADPPATDTAVSIEEQVSTTASTATGEPPAGGGEPSPSAPSTGLGSIDGPASVDPDFGGANPGGADDGG